MQYTSKFSGEEIDSILDSVASKQDAIPDLETIRSNSKNASDTIARMVESGYLFAGIATIDTNPGVPDAKVFYIANGKGTYTKFGGLEVTEDDMVVLYWDSAWHKVSTGIASQEKLSELELKTDKNSIVSVESNNILQGAIYKDGSFHDDGSGWEYVLFLVAPNDKITFKASGYKTNVISFYALGQTPSVNTYIEGMLCDGNGPSSYKEYNAIAKDFLIAAVCWYRPYGTPSISIERTSLIDNLDLITKDYDSKITAINLRNYPFSTNNEVNKYIKEVYVPSLPSGFAKGFITIMIGMKSSSTGLYFNTVRLGNTRSIYVEILFEKGFASIEDAISAATNYHIESTEEGAYCVVDFSSISSAFSKEFELEHYDVEKLYNSPKIEEYLHDKEVSNIKGDVSNIKKDIDEIEGLETVEPVVVGIQYGEIVSNGKINIGTSGTYKISEKINVSKGDIIKIVGSGYNTLMVAEYKAGTEPTPLSFIGGTPCENRVVKEYEYVCQENGYVLLCWASAYAKVETYTHIKAGKLNALNYKIEASNILNNPNKPLNILIFGDSISDSASIEVSEESLSAVTTSYSLPYNGNSFVVNGETIKYSMWPALLRRLFNVFDIRCYARYGATYINDSRNTIFRQNLSEQIALALNDLSNPNGVFMTNGSFEPDIVIFALSANDSNTPTDTYEIAMGKTIMSEDGNSFDVDATLANLDLTQFNQAVRYAFLKMKRQFPYALFFAIVPPQRAAYDIGETQKEKDLRRMAERYSIQIIDAAATCGILRDLEIKGSADVYSKDGLHPNNKGQNLYARMVANAIKNSLVDMTLLNE